MSWLFWTHNRFLADTNTSNIQDDDFRNDFLNNVTRITTQVNFGHESVARGRDSRYWDRDDRRRDGDYNEDEVYKRNTSMVGKGHFPDKGKSPSKISNNNMVSGTNRNGLYNEAGRDELRMYEKKYEASLKDIGQSGFKIKDENQISDSRNSDMENKEIDIDDEYDDGIDSHDARMDDYDNARHENEMHSELPKTHSDNGGDYIKAQYTPKILIEESPEDHSSKLLSSDNTEGKHSSGKQLKKHGRRHKFSGKISQ